MQRLKAKESEEEEEEEVEEEEEEEEVSSSTSSEVRKFGDWGRSHNHRACLLEFTTYCYVVGMDDIQFRKYSLYCSGRNPDNFFWFPILLFPRILTLTSCKYIIQLIHVLLRSPFCNGKLLGCSSGD